MSTDHLILLSLLYRSNTSLRSSTYADLHPFILSIKTFPVTRLDSTPRTKIALTHQQHHVHNIKKTDTFSDPTLPNNTIHHTIPYHYFSPSYQKPRRTYNNRHERIAPSIFSPQNSATVKTTAASIATTPSSIFVPVGGVLGKHIPCCYVRYDTHQILSHS